MNKLIEKLNFKKIFIIYLIMTLIIIISLSIFLSIKYKDKLNFIYNYYKISENFKEGKYNQTLIKESISNFDKNSSDIVDIMLLDQDNNIIYSANGTFNNEKLELSKVNDNKKYLVDSNNNIFKLTKNKELILNLVLDSKAKEFKDEYEDNYFYENNFLNNKIYMLNYINNHKTGEKIYFIIDVKPVANGILYIKASLAICMFLFMLYWILIVFLIYQNALKLKLNPYLWGLIVLFTNIFGVIIYLIYKKFGICCYKCNTYQDKNNIYCVNCGIKINKLCSKCGHIIKNNNKYCSKCGKKINWEEIK